MKATAVVLVLALGSAALPAAAQPGSQSDLAPGALVNLVLRLDRPVSVDLGGASVGRAAAAIEDAARVPIHVDSRVAGAGQVTLSARGVPLAVVLEQVARQANVFIAPLSPTNELLARIDQALLIVPAPSGPGAGLSAATPYAPWTNEWGLDPAAGVIASTGAAAVGPAAAPVAGDGARF